MNIFIFGVLSFLGLFMTAFGFVEKKPVFTMGGFFILMLVGTSLANSGLETLSGAETLNYGNGTMIVTDIFTTRSDWLTFAVARVMFFSAIFGALVEFMFQASGKSSRKE